MSKIDWSKAPEGATHFDPVDQNWLMQFLNISFGWLASEGWTTKGWQYPNDLSTMPRLISRPAWDGSGRPPAGVKCEHQCFGCSGWTAATVIAYGAKKTFYRDEHGHEWSRLSDEIKFRPIRTPEQIAAEQYERDAEEIAKILSGLDGADNTFIAKTLLDCGYSRKVQP